MNGRALSLACTALTVVAAPTAHAQTVWDGSSSTDWFTAANWSAGVPISVIDTTMDTTAPNPTVISGGAAASRMTGIGNAAATSGQVTVTGVGASWTVSNTFNVGGSGNGALIVQNGGQMRGGATVGGATVAANPGSTGTVTVTGVGCYFEPRARLVVGAAGNGALIVSNGGQVAAYSAGDVAYFAGSTGNVTVDGLGSRFDASGSVFRVGVGGNATLNILNGGAVQSGDNSIVGDNLGSTGTVTISGAGSRWGSRDFLRLGRAGSGTLTVQDGAGVGVRFLILAEESGSVGTLNFGAAAGAPAAGPPGTFFFWRRSCSFEALG